jgi:hypothetical protein
MQFRVPQFIDVEDKIFGPFTFKQFLYLAGGAGMSFVIYKTLPLILAILLVPPILGLSAALTFYRINNKPFIEILEYYFKFNTQNKLYIWKKKAKKKEVAAAVQAEAPAVVPRLSDSKLKDISWSLDVLDINKK